MPQILQPYNFLPDLKGFVCLCFAEIVMICSTTFPRISPPSKTRSTTSHRISPPSRTSALPPPPGSPRLQDLLYHLPQDLPAFKICSITFPRISPPSRSALPPSPGSPHLQDLLYHLPQDLPAFKNTQLCCESYSSCYSIPVTFMLI